MKMRRVKNNDRKTRQTKRKKKRIGKYILDKVVATSCTGTIVHTGIHCETGEIVVIKIVHLHNKNKADIESLRREVSFIQKIDHENILKYHYCKAKNLKVYIVMEYCPNGCLKDLIRKHEDQGLSERIIAKYIHQTLIGLEYLYKQGIIHQDIRATNLLLDSNNTIKLTGFKTPSTNREEENIGTVVGTPYYLAPELILWCEKPGEKSDVWSIGCLLHELITGNPPYFKYAPMAALYKIVQGEELPILEITNGKRKVSKECEDFINVCFERDPKKRPSVRMLRSHSWIRKFSCLEKLGQHKIDESERVRYILEPSNGMVDINFCFTRQSQIFSFLKLLMC